jgi:hypothetical protein
MATMMTPSRTRLLAFTLLIPASLFVVSNVLRYQVGIGQPYDALSPLWHTSFGSYQGAYEFAFNATVLVGPMIAMAIAALAVLRVRFARTHSDPYQEGWSVAVTIRRRWPEIGVLTFGVGLVGVMGLYLIAENLPCILGRQLYC